MPRTVLVQQVSIRFAFSLNLLNGEALFQALLFGIAMLEALGILVGYRRRLMTFVAWVSLLSIHCSARWSTAPRSSCCTVWDQEFFYEMGLLRPPFPVCPQARRGRRTQRRPRDRGQRQKEPRVGAYGNCWIRTPNLEGSRKRCTSLRPKDRSFGLLISRAPNLESIEILAAVVYTP